MSSTNKYEEKGLTVKQRKAIELLVYGNLNQVKTAREIGVDETTLTRWVNKNELFKSMLALASDEAVNYSKRLFKQKATRAVQIVCDLAEKADKDSVRLDACKYILDNAYRDENQSDKPIEIIIKDKEDG